MGTGIRRLWHHAIAWTAIAIIHALVVLADAARRDGTMGAPVSVVGFFVLGYLPWALLSWWLSGVVASRADIFSDRRKLARLLGIAFAFFFLPQLVYQSVLAAVLDGRSITTVPAQLRALSASSLVLDVVLFVATVAVIGMRAVAEQRRTDAAIQRQLDAENEALRLQTARQQLRVLQSQLEPHFLFNTLNAIGAMVRIDDRPRALAAIQQVATLLRFAAGASNRDRITWREELAFITDYLALQRLRFGNRLDVRFSTDDGRLPELTCPPLILQPLIENAIRHGVEREPGAVMIHIAVTVTDDVVVATVQNPLVDMVAENPGLGGGLRSLRDRLLLAYAGRARLETSTANGAYRATLIVPVDDDD